MLNILRLGAPRGVAACPIKSRRIPSSPIPIKTIHADPRSAFVASSVSRRMGPRYSAAIVKLPCGTCFKAMERLVNSLDPPLTLVLGASMLIERFALLRTIPLDTWVK